jgi:hypothetical protein
MRNAFGTGTTFVDVITGKEIKLERIAILLQVRYKMVTIQLQFVKMIEKITGL